jgi:PLP dependent protein
MATACSRAGRQAGEVALVAISKTVPLERLRLAQAAGHDRLGENRVQEAAAKAPSLGPAEWHLVGHLQQNKAARAVELFDVVESVDSIDLARRLDRLVADRGARSGGRLPVYLQVNVDADPAKAGFAPDELALALPAMLDLPHLDVRGLMTVGWLTAGGPQARPTFVRLRELSARLRSEDERLGAGLSMGMSDDYEIAIEEGSTLVRVGRALFGERPLATGVAAEESGAPSQGRA